MLATSRSIPAPAGEPTPAMATGEPRWVYPRACGGTVALYTNWDRLVGLSPRLRGNHITVRAGDGGSRSIPAPAGEPDCRGSRRSARRVYPRACGGTSSEFVCRGGGQGLSPRLRGNLPLGPAGGQCRGSIPAPAGEPRCRNSSSNSGRVYPRACGGTAGCAVRYTHCRGLSPRLRGNLLRTGQVVTQGRSIPAPAGEPPAPTRTRTWGTVYPRACGGTHFRRGPGAGLQGLSPRLRGNRLVGTAKNEKPGLSPRLRGNLRHRHGVPDPGRSIPAPAGEPRSRRPSAGWPAVYPRACGGTAPAPQPVRQLRGLSPRLRGNRCFRSSRAGLLGSIPAPAGEPAASGSASSPPTVYPRACGGTLELLPGGAGCLGLSPRLRGNLPVAVGGVGLFGSIPAPAGEPPGDSIVSIY